jgi:hypothetical protein
MSVLDLGIEPPERPQVGGADDYDDDAPPFDAPAGGAGEVFFEEDLPPEATEETVRLFLTGAGRFANRAAADVDVPDQWKFTDDELAAIVPPLTRIVNRRIWLRRLVAASDPLWLGLALAEYGARNLEDGRDARRARRDTIPTTAQEATTDADLEREDPRPHADADASAPIADGRAPGERWGPSVPAAEVAGLGVFQG